MDSGGPFGGTTPLYIKVESLTYFNQAIRLPSLILVSCIFLDEGYLHAHIETHNIVIPVYITALILCKECHIMAKLIDIIMTIEYFA